MKAGTDHKRPVLKGVELASESREDLVVVIHHTHGQW